MAYTVRIYCRDCEGDSMGCFDGGFEELGGIFHTREEAIAAAEKYLEEADCAPWSYEIVEG